MGNTTSLGSELKVERAQRIRQVRKMLGLTQAELAQYGLSLGVVCAWENARRKGLSEAGATRLADAFKKAGAIVSAQWLMDETGAAPILMAKTIEGKVVRPISASQSPNAALDEMLRFLHLHYGPTVDTVVPDNELAPVYHAGDFIIGLRLAADELHKGLNRHCIVNTAQGTTLIGLLLQNKSGEYRVATNLQASPNDANSIEIYSAAPIIFTLPKL